MARNMLTLPEMARNMDPPGIRDHPPNIWGSGPQGRPRRDPPGRPPKLGASGVKVSLRQKTMVDG